MITTTFQEQLTAANSLPTGGKLKLLNFLFPLQLLPTRYLKRRIKKERAAIEKIDIWQVDRAKMDAQIRRRRRRLEKVERYRLELMRREAGGFYLYDQLRMRR